MSRLIMISAAAVLALLVAPCLAQAREDGLSAAIGRAMAERGPIVTDTDKAAIRAKCGLPAGTELKSINFDDDGLRCPNGQVVRDEETAVMGKRIGERARGTAHAALHDPRVKAAIARYTSERTQAALERVRARRYD